MRNFNIFFADLWRNRIEERLLKQELANFKYVADATLKTENDILRKEVGILKNKLTSFLSEPQIKYFQDGWMMEWFNEGVIQCLKFRCTLSVNGYNYLRNTGFPLPGYSTLCRRIRELKINFGTFEDILELSNKLQDMDPSDRFCAVSYDEMYINEEMGFGKSGGEYVGPVTLEVRTVLSEKIFL